jgi:membrane associated rhomboid family serine protease
MKAARPIATIAIAGLTVGAYLIAAVTMRENWAVAFGGFVPASVRSVPIAGHLPWYLTPLSATLVHAGLLHLGFNLLTLVFCGREDEAAIGWSGVAVLYAAGAYAAAALEYAVSPHSPVPMIGASGAISALVGAYAVLYGRRRPSKLNPELARWLHVAWLAAAWIAVQLLIGVASVAAGMGIAIAAHVGGFLGGVLLARPLLRWRYRNA